MYATGIHSAAALPGRRVKFRTFFMATSRFFKKRLLFFRLGYYNELKDTRNCGRYGYYEKMPWESGLKWIYLVKGYIVQVRYRDCPESLRKESILGSQKQIDGTLRLFMGTTEAANTFV